MRHKQCKFYFCQFWACSNPEVLTYEDLRKVLWKKWRAIWKSFNTYTGEDKLTLITKLYKQEILKGKASEKIPS